MYLVHFLYLLPLVQMIDNNLSGEVSISIIHARIGWSGAGKSIRAGPSHITTQVYEALGLIPRGWSCDQQVIDLARKQCISSKSYGVCCCYRLGFHHSSVNKTPQSTHLKIKSDRALRLQWKGFKNVFAIFEGQPFLKIRSTWRPD